MNQCALSAKMTASPPSTGTSTSLTKMTPHSTLLGTLALPGPR